MHGATERLSPYTNAPLDLEGRGIRLVELQSSSSSDTIRCHLRSYALPPDGPSYIALSYQWGPCERYANIELNGMPFTVGRSLWTFLHQMRLHRVFKTFWIDAICIDQANVEERNHQVGMMRHIYLNAASVSIWLGEVEEDTLVGEAMKIMAPRNLRSGQTLDNIAHWKRWTTREIEAFQAFCEHKYWSRVWIIQEVALA
ncbi:HET-domain-containing protein, partial [Macroventuria anomochaeta]